MQKCYCGPNVAKYGLRKYQVFVGDDYAYNVKEAIHEIPEIEYLFCEVGELESMRSRIDDTGTAENLYYAKVESRIKELRRNENSIKQANRV